MSQKTPHLLQDLNPPDEQDDGGKPNTSDPATKMGNKRGGKRKKKPRNSPDGTEEKPKRPPQLHTDEEIRGMLAALQAEYPGMSLKDLVKLALRALCDKTAYLPPIRLARLDAATLRIQAGIAADAEANAEKVTRKIIKAKLDPAAQARLTDELEDEVAVFGELRRTMMRQAAIPMTPELPEAVAVGIEVLKHEKLECPDESRQYDCDICIQILRAYRPPELDLPEDLRDPFEPTKSPKAPNPKTILSNPNHSPPWPQKSNSNATGTKQHP